MLGGERRRRFDNAPMLDPQTLSYIRDVEIGAVKVEAPNEQPPASSEDDESINLCAAEAEWLDWPPCEDAS